MTRITSDAIKLYGTEEPVEPMQTLTAGPVSCQFDQGALRYIKVYGKEAIRNIAFVVRDKDWGTYLPALSNLVVDQSDHGFTITFDAVCHDGEQEIRYRAKIVGETDGTLTFSGSYESATGFLTNRTGFVVLHPVDGVSGYPVTVEKVDGEIVHAEFPELIDPIQPFRDLRALTHEVVPGVSVCCRMTGDTFEMEDHRQWNDASYKTYVRPLGLPWPYSIAPAESGQQAVTLTVKGKPKQSEVTKIDQAKKRCAIEVERSGSGGFMPRVGLGLEPQHVSSAENHLDLIKRLSLQHMVIWYELDKHNSGDLKQSAELCRGVKAEAVLYAVIPDEDYKAEIAELARQCQHADLIPAAISVAPAMYLRSIMPGTSWPDVTSLADIYTEVRAQFPRVTVGGGMLSFFPELNRHRPPTDQLDFITHASNTITHACDDITVTENLEALPYIIKSCRSFADGKSYHVGPSSIAMRFNPYGSKTMDNPDNTRIAMARMDPRHRGLINAAWTVGYIAHMSRGNVDSVSVHAPTGEFGVINHPQDWSQPGFDRMSRQVYPVYHAVAGLAGASGKAQLATTSTISRDVEAIAYEDNGFQVLWIANLTCELYTVDVTGLAFDHGDQATLSLDTFDVCTRSADGLEHTTTKANLPSLDLGPYAVVRIRAAAS